MPRASQIVSCALGLLLITVSPILRLPGSLLQAADRFVWQTAPSSGPPYTNWNSAATNIWDAVNAALDGETVWVTNGTYGLTNAITITKGITLRSVNGKLVTTLTRGTANGIRLLILSNSSVVVDGFSVTNGFGRGDTTNTAAYPGPSGHSYGGAIRMYSGTVRNCRIAKNTCKAGIVDGQHGVNGYGGGIYAVTGLIENCEVLNNTATGNGSDYAYGGGIEIANGRIVSCVVTGNLAQGTGNGEGRGGGIRMLGTTQLLSSRIEGNRVSASANVAPSYGAGVYMGGNGVVSNCTLVRNRCIFWESLGGGVYMTTGLVTHCTIVSNRCESYHTYAESQYGAGAGVWMSGGTLRNSVVAQNRCIHGAQIREGATRGAGILMTGGRVENCTVARNVVDIYGRGAGIYMTGGQVWNTVAYHNFDDAVTSYTEDHENLYQSGGTVNFSCVTNSYGLAGVGNVCGDPGFAYRLTNDYRLLPASSCIDAGSNLATVVSDVAGNVRPQDGDGDGQSRSDIGACEALPVNAGSFRAGFAVSPSTRVGSAADVVFRARVAGTQTNGLVYRWDLTNDGGFEWTGSMYAVLTNHYSGATNYTVRLVVTNDMAQMVTVVRPAAVRIFPPVVYVNNFGLNQYPYDTNEKGSTNIQAAIDAAIAGTTVMFSNGAYQVATPLSLRRGVTMTSYAGPRFTAIERKPAVNTRIMLVMHPDAVVEQLTLRNAYFSRSGMAYGGAIWLTAGLVRNCMLTNNLVNGEPNQPGYGGGIYMTGGTVRNCLLFRNESKSGNSLGHGGGIYISGGRVESCTVVSNYAQQANAGGGIRLVGGTVSNSVVADNGLRTVTTSGIQISPFGDPKVRYCCSPDVTHDPAVTGNITNKPLFVNVTNADYRPQISSVCVDAGKNQSWMTGTKDLYGKRRRSPRRVDIGAYEYQFPLPSMLIVR